MSERDYNNAILAIRDGELARCHDIAGALLEIDQNDGYATLLRSLSCAPNETVLARALCRAACRQMPFSAEAWFNMGVLHGQCSEMQQAIDAYQRAYNFDPCHLGVLQNGAELLRVNEHFEQAIKWSKCLIELDPQNPAGYSHLAISLSCLDRHEECDAAFGKALELSNDPSLLLWERHFSLLQRKVFPAAWAGYEQRFACGRWNGVSDMAFDLPRWDGSARGHILVYGEQGIGDQIMFANALQDLGQVVDKVSLAVGPWLTSLMSASFPEVSVFSIFEGGDAEQCLQVVAEAEARRGPVDFVLPIGSLMSHFRTELASFSGSPYLKPTSEARKRWRTGVVAGSVGKRGKAARPLRVGLCWSSNPAPERFFTARRARNKSMSLMQMARLAQLHPISAISLANVSLAVITEDSSILQSMVDVAEKLTDLNETAALIETLDLVITVDTAVAHLAGALGKRTWILLHKGGDARWGPHNAAKSYWYSSIELFWQSEKGNWDELLDRVGDRLIALLSKDEC